LFKLLVSSREPLLSSKVFVDQQWFKRIWFKRLLKFLLLDSCRSLKKSLASNCLTWLKLLVSSREPLLNSKFQSSCWASKDT
jgi:hypothetical protein